MPGKYSGSTGKWWKHGEVKKGWKNFHSLGVCLLHLDRLSVVLLEYSAPDHYSSAPQSLHSGAHLGGRTSALHLTPRWSALAYLSAHLGVPALLPSVILSFVKYGRYIR